MELDDIGGRNLAVRLKWQPFWKSCSVQAVKEDDAVIQDILSQFPKDEETSKLCIAGASTVAAAEQDLSATSEHNPEVLALTPGKRVADHSLEVINDSQDLAPTQQSSTKMKKITIKTEKN
ncbi:replication factor-A carboxy-terminal domain protein [Trifolium medium]|uniref:Replication factor-A carboxy-terminal domain protein n=1 Tax=Trifolium medium TaxID=97028 RepID=A0A392P5C0_9FABA|nr:replication factor-A carboxy-terminal domain protein [Trifolium medium]